MTWAIRVLVLVVLSAIAFSEAQACTCAVGDGPACQETWRKSVDAVFLGRVENIELTHGRPIFASDAMSMTMMGGLLRVTIAVEEAYRGSSEKTLQVYTAASSAACGYEFQKGRSYLIFASMTKDSRLTVSLCSATRPENRAEEDITYLRSVPSLAATAKIMGSVWRYTYDPNFKPKVEPSLMDYYRPREQDYMAMVPVPGFTVIVKALLDGTDHVATVNSDGDWVISDLKPGLYTVRTQSNDETFVHPYFANIEVAPRGCAQVNIRIESNGRISGILEHRPPRSDWALLEVFVLSLPNPDWRRPVREIALKPDESAFEIGPLPPGRYVLGAYLVVRVGTPDSYTLADIGRTYLPGVFDPNRAQEIDVAEGKAVTNLKLKVAF